MTISTKYCQYCNNSLRKSYSLSHEDNNGISIYYCKNHNNIVCRFTFSNDQISEIHLYDEKYVVYLIYPTGSFTNHCTEIYVKNSKFDREQILNVPKIVNINPDNFYNKLKTFHIFS